MSWRIRRQKKAKRRKGLSHVLKELGEKEEIKGGFYALSQEWSTKSEGGKRHGKKSTKERPAMVRGGPRHF